MSYSNHVQYAFKTFIESTKTHSTGILCGQVINQSGHLDLTLKVLVATIDAQWEGMGM